MVISLPLTAAFSEMSTFDTLDGESGKEFLYKYSSTQTMRI